MSQVQDPNCCPDTEDLVESYDPRKGRRRSRRTIFDQVHRRNPIERQVSDDKETQKFFRHFPFYPFAGDNIESGDTLLSFFLAMAELSSTHGSCIHYQKLFSISGKVEVEYASDSVFEDEDKDDVPYGLKIQFVDFLKSVKLNKGYDWKKLATSIFEDYKKTGNAYFTLSMSESFGVKSAAIIHRSVSDCRYVVQKDKEVDYIGISKVWTKKYLQENPVEVYPVYPQYFNEEDGTWKTIFHIKNGSERYGRPQSMQSFMYWYREFQDASYLIKESDNGWTGKAIIETEAGDPELDDDAGDFDSVVDRMEASFTNKGEDPLQFVYMERPKGSSAVHVFQFTPNTNEKFYEVAGKISEEKIIYAHNWSKRLLGDSVSNGLSGNVFMQELITKMPVIIANQEISEVPLNQAIKEIVLFMGLSELEGLAIKFKSPFKNMIDDFAKSNNWMGGSTVQSGEEGLSGITRM